MATKDALTNTLTRLPRSIRDLAAITLTACVALLDLLAPTYLILTGIYILPLFLAIWYAQRWAAITVLLLAMAMTIYESWQLLPDAAAWWINVVEYVSLAIVFPLVAGLLWYAKYAVVSLERAASVFHHAREGIVITDAVGNIIDANDTFSRITGYDHDEVIGKNPRIFKSGHQSPEFYRDMWQAIAEHGAWSGEILNRRKTGEIYAELLTISAVRDRRGGAQSYIALFSDITPMREHQRELERIAHYDPLTGLPNRVLLADRLQQALSQGQRKRQGVAVVFLDLDGFKAVNDRHGHDAGDALLVEASLRMKSALRDEDTLARVGGDEFVAVLAGINVVADCESLLERLLAAAAKPLVINGTSLQVSSSIGVAFFPQDGEHAEQLLRYADQAMYAAKQAGKNRYQLFDTVQNSQVRKRHRMLENIQQGLERGEFELYFQPKVNMRLGRVIGAEALIRWRHPEQGLLSPAAFLPHLENEPLNERVGAWVLETAVEQMDCWAAAGLRLPVSVNISARQLQQLEFAANLATLLGRFPQVDPSDLTLEILETNALDDMDVATRVMRECFTLGVRFALDDFGTGYSSLAYLKRLQVDEIKIDQGFVRNMLDDAGDRAIVEGVLSLATVFGRGVIAEGVETEAHGLELLRLGCAQAQGYGIARPMPAHALPEWLAAWQPCASWQNWPCQDAVPPAPFSKSTFDKSIINLRP
jgi:diguanylate cyclase (GGDEF)-like protein/PAS domain S-box-containing protein